jgi:hypothetical protein
MQIATLISAVRYCEAAKRDERSGFALTAAWEWRQAVELSVSILFLANHCWRQWERIMHLPRRLAGPISLAFEPELTPEGIRPIFTGEFCPILDAALSTPISASGTQ